MKGQIDMKLGVEVGAVLVGSTGEKLPSVLEEEGGLDEVGTQEGKGLGRRFLRPQGDLLLSGQPGVVRRVAGGVAVRVSSIFS